LKAGTSAGRKLVLLFFLAGLTVSVGWTAAKSLRRIQKAFLYAGESALAERSREFGAPYARKVEEIRGLIPQDGVYGLVDGDADGVEIGGTLWVRFDLAPRRAAFLGLRKDLPGNPAELRRRLPPGVRWVVIGHSDRPPETMDLMESPRRPMAMNGDE
jgi:hypothetical protein